jgi:hypothetical protein
MPKEVLTVGMEQSCQKSKFQLGICLRKLDHQGKKCSFLQSTLKQKQKVDLSLQPDPARASEFLKTRKITS